MFLYFCCSLLINCQHLAFPQYKALLEIIFKASRAIPEAQADHMLLTTLFLHARDLKVHDYWLLYSDWFASLEKYVKKKKTALILLYMEFVREFIEGEIAEMDLSSKKKQEQIKRYRKLGFIKHLELISENRQLNTKILNYDICRLLLQHYFEFIDLQLEAVFMLIAEDATHVVKHLGNEALLLSWIKYIFTLLDAIGALKDVSLMPATEIELFLKQSQLLEVLQDLILRELSTPELVEYCLLIIKLFSGAKYSIINHSNIGQFQTVLHSLMQKYGKVERIVLLAEHLLSIT